MNDPDKNKLTPNAQAVNDYEICFEKLAFFQVKVYKFGF